MFSTLICVAMAAASEPRIVATLQGPDFQRRGIVAELVERPVGLTDEKFAQQLIQASGIRPWNGEQSFASEAGGMATKAVFSADGRELIVKYVNSGVDRTGRVCRISMARGGMSIARWNAYRWCASAFGIRLPKTPSSPIAKMQE